MLMNETQCMHTPNGKTAYNCQKGSTSYYFTGISFPFVRVSNSRNGLLFGDIRQLQLLALAMGNMDSIFGFAPAADEREAF
jgi:hypothetical protein